MTPTCAGRSYRRSHIPPAQAPSHIRIRSSRRARLLTQQRAQPDELDERMRGTLALPNPSLQPSAPVDETVGWSRRRPRSSGRRPKEPQRQAPGRGTRRQDANVYARTAPQASKCKSSHLQNLCPCTNECAPNHTKTCVARHSGTKLLTKTNGISTILKRAKSVTKPTRAGSYAHRQISVGDAT